jgi:2,3-diaminopropionate biosynthesis protein SbnA
MLKKLIEIGKLIGNTPLLKLENEPACLYAKFESKNYSGSVKDRAVNHMLHQAILENKINERTTVIESSSGNYAISLALHCKYLGLKFIAVVDPNINAGSLKIIKLLATKIIMVTELDETGGYLLNRIRKVKEIVAGNPNFFWTNQYENENNYKSYYPLAKEVIKDLPDLDYLFVAVSTCGTVMGLSLVCKQHFPGLKVIGVDIQGSMIFSEAMHKRYIPGIGSSRKPFFKIDDVVDDHVIVTHSEIIAGCHELLHKHGVFCGASSGACYAAVQKYLQAPGVQPLAKVLIILPDSGTTYIDNIYNPEWIKKIDKAIKEECII